MTEAQRDAFERILDEATPDLTPAPAGFYALVAYRPPRPRRGLLRAEPAHVEMVGKPEQNPSSALGVSAHLGRTRQYKRSHWFIVLRETGGLTVGTPVSPYTQLAYRSLTGRRSAS